MKKFNRIIALLALLLVSIPAFSDWRFGINVSYENTGADWELDEKIKGINKISGFSIGPSVAHEAVENYFDIQSGLSFAMNGFSVQDQSIFGNNHLLKEEEIVKLYYLQLPVYAVGKLPVKEASLILEVGPIFAAGVGGNATTIYKAGDKTYTEDRDDIFEHGLSRFNCLIHFGLGAEYLGAKLTVGYNLGVFDMIEDGHVRSDLTTDGFFVSIGYVFDFD